MFGWSMGLRRCVPGRVAVGLLAALVAAADLRGQEGVSVTESAETLQIETLELSAAINKKGYVTGIKGQTFVDKKTGAHDLGFGLDIVDWIMEPGSDEAYRDKLEPELVYKFGNPYHGKTPKRSIEGPQICTQAKTMEPHIVRGKDFARSGRRSSTAPPPPARRPAPNGRSGSSSPKGSGTSFRWTGSTP